MTKRREPLTYEHTLTRVAAAIGWDRAAAICGLKERAVRAWSEPDCEKNIRLIDAERLDRAFIEFGGDHPPFHTLFALRIDLASSGASADLAQVAANAARESGEAVGALVDLSQHNDKAHRRAARKELEEAIEAHTAALRAIDRAEGADGAESHASRPHPPP